MIAVTTNLTTYQRDNTKNQPSCPVHHRIRGDASSGLFPAHAVVKIF